MTAPKPYKVVHSEIGRDKPVLVSETGKLIGWVQWRFKGHWDAILRARREYTDPVIGDAPTSNEAAALVYDAWKEQG